MIFPHGKIFYKDKAKEKNGVVPVQPLRDEFAKLPSIIQIIQLFS